MKRYDSRELFTVIPHFLAYEEQRNEKLGSVVERAPRRLGYRDVLSEQDAV